MSAPGGPLFIGFTGRLEAAGGLPPDAIASHAEPAEVKADPLEEVGVGQGGQP